MYRKIRRDKYYAKNFGNWTGPQYRWIPQKSAEYLRNSVQNPKPHEDPKTKNAISSSIPLFFPLYPIGLQSGMHGWA